MTERGRLERGPTGRGNRYEFTPAQRRHIRRSYEQGASLATIGRQYGIQETPIRRVLVEEGVTIRPACRAFPAGNWREDGPEAEPVTDPAREYAWTRALVYPDRERRQWIYGMVLSWYRRQEEER